MARDWSDLFVLDGEPVTPVQEPEVESSGFFRRLRDNLSKTRQALSAEVQATLFEQLDDETWERLEEALIYADVGARTTADVVERLEREAESGEVDGGEALTARLIELLAEAATPQRDGADRIDLTATPTVILTVGVNGTGKTTTIGKLAWHLRRTLGRSVVIGAADTFRAAAVEQLEEWARRAECEFVRGTADADPGAVAFDTVRHAREHGLDVAIVDTAGRLHTQDDLMAELTKVARVIGKQLPRSAARDAADRRRHDRAERPAPGEAVRRGGPRHRHRADQARRDRQGRDRARDRAGAGHPGEADRGGRAARGPAPVRPRRLRARAAELIELESRP